jgi:hypothetical protein
MRRIFWGFCRNWVLMDPLHYVPFEPFRFWLRIRGDIRNRKPTPRLGESGSRCSNFLKFSIDFPDYKWLNQPFKRSI